MSGYDPNFLDEPVPLPSFSSTLFEDVLERPELSPDEAHDGRRILANYENYTVVMSKSQRTALFSAVNCDQGLLKPVSRSDDWREDERVGAANQLNNDYYRNNPWDRGHLTRRVAAAWGDMNEKAKKASDDTFYYTNAALQHSNFNQDEWLELEDWVLELELDANGKISVITGPIFGEFDRTVSPEGRLPAQVPAGFFKLVVFINHQNKLDVRAFVMLQDEESLRDKYGRRMFNHQRYQVSTEEVERLTGLAFAPELSYYNPVADDERPIEVDDPKEIVGPDGQRVVVRDDDVPIYIAAALVNAPGDEQTNEWVSIINLSDEGVDLTGWKLKDPQGELHISGSLAPGQAVQIKPLSPVSLGNKGGSISLWNGEERVDRVKYPRQGGSLEGKPVLFFWRTPVAM